MGLTLYLSTMGDRESMLQDILWEVEMTRGYTGKNALDARVLQAMREVPRERFVPEELRAMAFRNGPLPIGHGQTISQPYIVALMTDLLAPEPEDVMLEIGTGSGYQAAVLSRLVRKVYSLEIIGALAQAAKQRLSALGYDNVEVQHRDGYQGLPEHAPYDGIIVTAAAPFIPPPSSSNSSRAHASSSRWGAQVGRRRSKWWKNSPMARSRSATCSG